MARPFAIPFNTGHHRHDTAGLRLPQSATIHYFYPSHTHTHTLPLKNAFVQVNQSMHASQEVVSSPVLHTGFGNWYPPLYIWQMSRCHHLQLQSSMLFLVTSGVAHTQLHTSRSLLRAACSWSGGYHRTTNEAKPAMKVAFHRSRDGQFPSSRVRPDRRSRTDGAGSTIISPLHQLSWRCHWACIGIA